MNKQTIIGIVIAIGAILIAVFMFGLDGSATPRPDSAAQSDAIMVTSSNPAPLKEKKEVVVIPTQTIELTFNQPLENAPETKVVLEPPADIKVQVSDDKKTVKIIPNTPFKLGQGYTLFI